MAGSLLARWCPCNIDQPGDRLAQLFTAYPPIVWATFLATAERFSFAGAPPQGLLVQMPGHHVGTLAFAVGVSGGPLCTPVLSLFALGDVALFCVAALSLPALFVAPVAARWSARIPVLVLRRLFALRLGAIALGLVLRT